MNPLEAALLDASPRHLPLLPLVHVSVGRYLEEISELGVLRPLHCSIFARDLLYLSYGAPYYRPHVAQTQDALELPIAFVYDVSALTRIWRYYPFDTGAMKRGVFGKDWMRRLGNLECLYTSAAPDLLVSALYSDNDSYLMGRPTREAHRTEPLPSLSTFLSEDMSSSEVDQRQRTIECIAAEAFALDRELLWMAYPRSFAKQVRRIWHNASDKFDSHSYRAGVSESPKALVTHIAHVARERFAYYHAPPG